MREKTKQFGALSNGELQEANKQLADFCTAFMPDSENTELAEPIRLVNEAIRAWKKSKTSEYANKLLSGLSHPELVSGSKVQGNNINCAKHRKSPIRLFAHSPIRSKRVAFTLAEVLITLGVIGIVVAITMPTLIKNYQKQMFANKVKYTYSLLANVFERSKLDNGEFDTWDIGTAKNYPSEDADLAEYDSEKRNDIKLIVEKYFAPYLKIVKRIEPDAGQYYHIVIANGITLSFKTDGIIKNGIYKPSVISIVASTNNNITPNSDTSRDYSRHDILMRINSNKLRLYNSSNLKDGCNNNVARNKRYNCAALIMQNGWQIPDDYPW